MSLSHYAKTALVVVHTLIGSGEDGASAPVPASAAAGGSDGKDGLPPKEVKLSCPTGLAFDRASATLTITDTGLHQLKQHHFKAEKTITLCGTGAMGYADGALPAARFNRPAGIRLDQSSAVGGDRHGTFVLTEMINETIRRVSTHGRAYGAGSQQSNGRDVVTVAGANTGKRDGVGKEAEFATPSDLVVDPVTGIIYVSDTTNCRVRAIDPITCGVTTICGTAEDSNVDGPALVSASLNAPCALALAARMPHAIVYIACSHAIRLFDTKSKAVITYCTSIADPRGLVETPSGHLIVSDHATHSIYAVDLFGRTTLLAGAGPQAAEEKKGAAAAAAARVVSGYVDSEGAGALFHCPTGLALDDRIDERCLYVADSKNRRIRKVELPPLYWTTDVARQTAKKDMNDSSLPQAGVKIFGIVAEPIVVAAPTPAPAAAAAPASTAAGPNGANGNAAKGGDAAPAGAAAATNGHANGSGNGTENGAAAKGDSAKAEGQTCRACNSSCAVM